MKIYKNIIINFSVLIIGILIGWLLIGGNSNAQETKNEEHNHISENQTWTCSMHPQIKQPDSGDCPICGMDLIPMTNSSGNSNLAQIEMSEEAIQLANIQTSRVELSSTEKEIFLQGKIEVDERLISTQSIHFAGRIEKLFIAFEGEKISKGQKLATIYSPQLVSAQNELFEAIKSKENYPQLYTAARNKLKLWKLTDKQISDIEKKGIVQENFIITADVSGYVMKRAVSVGDYVKTGDMLFKIANLNRLWVVFDVYEKDLPFVSLHNNVDFTVNSLPEKSFSAKVSYIDPVINSQKRTASVRTELTNTNGLLKPEMFVSGKLTANLSHKENAIVVPKSAIMWTGKRSIIYVKVPDIDIPVFELREIELGEPLGNFYVVISGINEGDYIVTNGAFTVDAAAQLNSKYSMMNPPIKEVDENIPDYRKIAPKKFIKQLNEVLSSYLTLNESLIAANAQSAKKEALKISANLKGVEMKLLKGESHEYWMKQLKILNNEAKKISQIENIDTQRKSFKSLSDAMIKVIRSFGLQSGKVYVQFCPMADNDKGAFWLSTQKEIANPYFGDMMLSCGETKDSIK